MALAALHDVRAAAGGSATRLLSVPIPAGLLPLPSTRDMDLAAAAACHQVLRHRYPNQAATLESAWLHWLDDVAMGSATASVETAGRAYGTAVHQLGKDDRSHAGGAYTPHGMPSNPKAAATQPTQGVLGGLWGFAMPLASTRVRNFPPPPGRLDAVAVTPSRQDRHDGGTAIAKGDSHRAPGDPAFRSLAEEVIGIAWSFEGPEELGSPPRLYLQVVLSVLDAIAERHPGQLQALDELAVIAAAAVAMADAGIDAWYYKNAPTHRMGRPDNDASVRGLTPDFPAYPSGHATFGAAAFQLLRLFLVERGISRFDPAGSGLDDVGFEFVSDEFDGRHRDPRIQRPRDLLTLSYDSLWQAMVDNAVSRVYLGAHRLFDGITTRLPGTSEDVFGVPATPRELGHTGGVWLGAQIANQLAQKLNISTATMAASGIP
jgi:vanadium chloroperoxidase